MKAKNNLFVTVLSSVVCLLPVILSFAVYNDLPERVAVHWNAMGVPDNFVPKAIAAFGLPFLFLMINLFSKMRLFSDPKRGGASQAMQLFAIWMPPVLSLIIVPVTLFISMGVNISITLIVPVLVGITLLISGNYLPKCRQNYTVGIRLPWTLHDSDNWNKTHRMAGYLYVSGGIAVIAGAFIFCGNPLQIACLMVLVIIAIVFAPMLYSYRIYKKTGNL